MNSTFLKIIKSREDISDYLFHFTKKNNAKETLHKIIDDNYLKDIGEKGVLCFTESPITLLIEMFKIFEKYPNPMYSPYGIAVKKDYFFNLGGRTVVYGSSEDKKELLPSSQWRFEEHKPQIRDFSWLREWRINKKELELDKDNFFVITKTKKELEEIVFDKSNIIDIEFDGDVADGQFCGFATGIIGRSFKGISIEDIEDFNKLSKEELEIILSNQNLDDTSGTNLGSFVM
ncbi:hypothetical protein [Flavobacterium gilvum]|uniref:Uncharacterized protein n=1 Tax=Flavobacterium gilvum TaxID=1492737 RepID=A0AAC9I783_9FLAO|nr:hypothetical protein [Flavobacterium gilvum]AOW11055.1 hypothetical protein EM308_17045 [Flavobacterium gilvum]KFC58001.1 hypothetical protein FEM08_32400 [Flavobacterium gilvum]